MKLWAVVWTDTTLFHDRGRLLLGIHDSLDKAVSHADSCFNFPPYSTHTWEAATVEDDDGNALETAMFHIRKYAESRRQYTCEILPYTLNKV